MIHLTGSRNSNTEPLRAGNNGRLYQVNSGADGQWGQQYPARPEPRVYSDHPTYRDYSAPQTYGQQLSRSPATGVNQIVGPSQGWTETGYNRYPRKKNFGRGGRSSKYGKREGAEGAQPVCTVFNTPIEEIYKQNPHLFPQPWKKPPYACTRTDTGKYCTHHQSGTHNTEDCQTLRGVAEQLYQDGKLDRYADSTPQVSCEGCKETPTVLLGTASTDAKKAQAGSVEDRILGRGRDQYRHHPMTTPSNIRQGEPANQFFGETVQPLGSIWLNVEVGQYPKSRKIFTHMLVVDCENLPTTSSSADRSSVRSRRAYAITCSRSNSPPPLESPQSEEVNPWPGRATRRKPNRDNPTGIQNGQDRDGPTGTLLRDGLIRLLKENASVFAWSYADMPGISTKIISHKLGIDPAYRPVRQKRRIGDQERYEAMKVEVDKLLSIGSSGMSNILGG
ncbi:hypothetical protein M0R45_006978 [Rubus argutus]|uniref:Uncharacterized protein n=1 Tax=Rubus argutus TaxID=59490 RepID=A0AAW1YS57_RUBAR